MLRLEHRLFAPDVPSWEWTVLAGPAFLLEHTP